jgi:hypothetical protein
MKRILISASALALVLTAATAASAEAQGHGKWHTPDCSVVQSDGSLTYTTDEGRTVTPTAGTLHITKYVFGIVPLATPNTLLAVDNTARLYLSRDAGCSWSMFNKADGLYDPRLTASPDGTAYLWGVNSNRVLHVSGTELTEMSPVVDDGSSLVALAADPHHPQHLRAVTDAGRIYDSSDAGAHFAPVGQRAGDDTTWLYSASIDPKHIDHVVLGSLSHGSYVTRNAGRTWHNDGMGQPGDEVNAFSVAISPANSRVVYAQGINIRENMANLPSEGRHLYQSLDGGQTFHPILDQGDGVTLQNGTLLAPSPADPYKLYFVFSMSYANYGTDLFTLDTRAHRLSLAHDPHTRLTSIAFSPDDPGVMYLGFGAEFIF